MHTVAVQDSGRREPRPPKRPGPDAPRRVVVLAVPPVEELDLVGPIQVFSTAARLRKGRTKAYDIRIVTTRRDRRISGEGGLAMVAHAHYRDIRGPIDSLLLVCGVASRNACDAELAAWLRSTVPGCRRVGAVCVAAFLLARARVLTDHRATVHWKYAHELARRYPRLSIDPDPIWVKSGNVYTSSGFSAGIDLALAWVEEDYGSAIAHESARELVLFLRRPGSQAQLSVALAAHAKETRPIRELRVWIAENLRRRDLSTPALAGRLAMSVRNFERVFAADVGTTPAKYVRHLRVEAARRLLESTPRGLKEIARAVGFGNADVMRRAFVQVLGTPPSRLRARDGAVTQ